MTELSRRQFFKLGVDVEVEPDDGLTRQEKKRHRLIRPPGAVSGDRFLELCTKCGDCATACPHEIIDFAPAATGRSEGTPVLHPERDPCRWCVDMPCIAACEVDALVMTDVETLPPVAVAKLSLTECMTAQGILCDTCAVMCPTSIRAIRMVNGRLPVLDAKKCVGCGLCARFCPAEPNAIHIEPLPDKRKKTKS